MYLKRTNFLTIFEQFKFLLLMASHYSSFESLDHFTFNIKSKVIYFQPSFHINKVICFGHIHSPNNEFHCITM